MADSLLGDKDGNPTRVVGAVKIYQPDSDPNALVPLVGTGVTTSPFGPGGGTETDIENYLNDIALQNRTVTGLSADYDPTEPYVTLDGAFTKRGYYTFNGTLDGYTEGQVYPSTLAYVELGIVPAVSDPLSWWDESGKVTDTGEFAWDMYNTQIMLQEDSDHTWFPLKEGDVVPLEVYAELNGTAPVGVFVDSQGMLTSRGAAVFNAQTGDIASYVVDSQTPTGQVVLGPVSLADALVPVPPSALLQNNNYYVLPDGTVTFEGAKYLRQVGDGAFLDIQEGEYPPESAFDFIPGDPIYISDTGILTQAGTEKLSTLGKTVSVGTEASLDLYDDLNLKPTPEALIVKTGTQKVGTLTTIGTEYFSGLSSLSEYNIIGPITPYITVAPLEAYDALGTTPYDFHGSADPFIKDGAFTPLGAETLGVIEKYATVEDYQAIGDPRASDDNPDAPIGTGFGEDRFNEDSDLVDVSDEDAELVGDDTVETIDDTIQEMYLDTSDASLDPNVSTKASSRGGARIPIYCYPSQGGYNGRLSRARGALDPDLDNSTQSLDGPRPIKGDNGVITPDIPTQTNVADTATVNIDFGSDFTVIGVVSNAKVLVRYGDDKTFETIELGKPMRDFGVVEGTGVDSDGKDYFTFVGSDVQYRVGD